MMRIEAKKHGLKQLVGNDWVVTLIVSNEDCKLWDVGGDEMGCRYNLEVTRAEDDEENAEYTEIDVKPRKIHEMKLSEQAALLCEREEFQKFLGTKGFPVSKEGARQGILDICELVRSRSELDTNVRAKQDFITLLQLFEGWRTECRYADNLDRYER